MSQVSFRTANGMSPRGRFHSLGPRPRRGGQPCVGARVTAVVDGYRLVCILAGRTRYLSTSDSRFFIALGAANRADRLEFRRPSGASQPWS